jgi:hypothetical protein
MGSFSVKEGICDGEMIMLGRTKKQDGNRIREIIGSREL